MRAAVISDIHSNLDAFETVISKLPQYDMLLCLGDIVGYGPQPNEVVERLQELHPRVILMGNHDNAVVTGDTSDFSTHAASAVHWTRRHIKPRHLQFLSNLKPSQKLEAASNSIALFHGSPRNPLSEYIFPGMSQSSARSLIDMASSDVVLLGHTHMPMLYSFSKKLLANPGSVGQPRDGDPRGSFAILTLSNNRIAFDIDRVEYDVDSVADKIRKNGLPDFLADRLYVGM